LPEDADDEVEGEDAWEAHLCNVGINIRIYGQ